MCDTELSDTWNMIEVKQQQGTSKPSDINTYGEGVVPVHTITTLGGFWRLYHNINRFSEMSPGDYCFFRTGWKPVWEDEGYYDVTGGGRWVISLDGLKLQVMDDVLLLVTLYMILGKLEDETLLKGISYMARRKFNKIALWFNSNEDLATLPIVRKVYSVINIIATDCKWKADRIEFDDFPNKSKRDADPKTLIDDYDAV
eukprot:GHVR01108719.1.p1 GENE.GHVR01108719.1~~GHVR01108719.1.p1  ORF type:complete len:200 (-),score=50.17 GHVR01108719.1:66-665(-)